MGLNTNDLLYPLPDIYLTPSHVFLRGFSLAYTWAMSALYPKAAVELIGC